MSRVHVLDGKGLPASVTAIQRQVVLWYGSRGERDEDIPSPWPGAVTMFPQSGGLILEAWNGSTWVLIGIDQAAADDRWINSDGDQMNGRLTMGVNPPNAYKIRWLPPTGTYGFDIGAAGSEHFYVTWLGDPLFPPLDITGKVVAANRSFKAWGSEVLTKANGPRGIIARIQGAIAGSSITTAGIRLFTLAGVAVETGRQYRMTWTVRAGYSTVG